MSVFKKIIIFAFCINSSLYGQQTNYEGEFLSVIIDRSAYVPGEDLYFSIMGINHEGINSSEFSKLAYVEVINAKGFSILRDKVKLEQGMGDGMFVLPDTLSSGVYRFIAYTNCMKNNDVNDVSYNNILIYNPQKQLRSFEAKNSRQFKYKISSNELVRGLKNKIYYKIKDLDHITSISILTDTGAIETYSVKKDFGFIEFKPKTQENYYIRIGEKDGDKQILPKINEEGVIFDLYKETDKYTIFRVQSSEKYASIVDEVYYKCNESKMVGRLELGSEVLLKIPKDSLKKGLNKIVFNNNGKVLWERYFFYHRENAEIYTEGINENGFGTRERVALKVRVNENTSPDEKKLFFAVSVRKVPGNTIRFQELELNKENMLNKFNEQLIFAKEDEKKFICERAGILLGGRILESGGNPFENKDIFLSHPDSVINVRKTQTNEEGEFHFFMNSDKAKKDVVINTNDNAKNLTVIIDNNYLNQYDDFNTTPYEKDLTSHKDYLDRLYLNSRINKLYEIRHVKSEVENSESNNYSFYSNPDKIVRFDQYIQLDSISEYFYEIIPEVKVTETKEDTKFRVLNKNTNYAYRAEPVVFVDGVIISDIRSFLDIDPALCERIEIIQDPVILRNEVFYGAVILYTKDYSLKGVDLSSNSTRINYKLYDIPKMLWYDKDLEKNIPDFRNTLYWDSLATMNSTEHKTIEFYTGDDNSWYEIFIQGYTESGEKIYMRDFFKVGEPGDISK